MNNQSYWTAAVISDMVCQRLGIAVTPQAVRSAIDRGNLASTIIAGRRMVRLADAIAYFSRTRGKVGRPQKKKKPAGAKAPASD